MAAFIWWAVGVLSVLAVMAGWETAERVSKRSKWDRAEEIERIAAAVVAAHELRFIHESWQDRGARVWAEMCNKAKAPSKDCKCASRPKR